MQVIDKQYKCILIFFCLVYQAINKLNQIGNRKWVYLIHNTSIYKTFKIKEFSVKHKISIATN